MKIILSDYDGTLNHGGITQEKIEAIEKWRAAGNLFSVVSGRQKEFFLDLKNDNIPLDYFLACNGAVITDGEQNIIKDFRCEGSVALPLIEFLFSFGCSFANVCKDTFLRVVNEAFPEEEGKKISEIKEISYFNQISTDLPDFETAGKVTAAVKEKFGKFVNPLQNGTCIDIVPKGIDKAQGIYKLLEIIDGKFEDVIAVGDNINDEAMIREFYSYAMANGVDRIKKLADNITFSIEELIEKEI